MHDGTRLLCFDTDPSTWQLVFIQMFLMLVKVIGVTCHSLDKDGQALPYLPLQCPQ